MTHFNCLCFLYFKGKRKRQSRRDAITESEIYLYKSAFTKEGNDWKKIIAFFAKHKDFLNEYLANKYEMAAQNMSDKEAIKSVRNRLGNIARRAKNSVEVTQVEERHVLKETANTAEEVIQELRQKGEGNASPTTGESDCEGSDIQAMPGPSSQISSSPEPEFDFDASSDVEEPVAEAPLKTPSKKKKRGKGKKKSLEDLHARAEQLMSVGLATAKLHMKFLQKSARSQGLSLSESDSD